MPTERIALRRVREMLRLTLDGGLPIAEAARRMAVARSTVREMAGRFERSGLAWPLPLDLVDGDLEARLYGAVGKKQGHRRVAKPDWAALNWELKRKHVTLQILWDEYIDAEPDGYRYSLRELASASADHHVPAAPGRRQDVRGMRRRHRAGDCRPAGRRDAGG